MKNDLVSADLQLISPQAISDRLDWVVKKIAGGKFADEQTVFMYNILYSTSCLLVRYKTICSEAFFAAIVEEDDKKLRETIITLCHKLIGQDIAVAQLHIDNT